MEYWVNVLAMAGSACIAVVFLDRTIYGLTCGMILSIAGYFFWRKINA